MDDETYKKYSKDNLILRDWLAVDRTELANERTFMAYIRTALAVFAVGATFIHFFENEVLIMIGWLMLPLGLVIFVYGAKKFYQTRESMKHLTENRPKFKR